MYRLLTLTLVLAVDGAPGNPLDERIVGGRSTTIEEYPYQVSLHYFSSLICGGSIISPEYVITAAHCTYGNFDKALTVRAGSNITDNDGQEITVKTVYQNPLFDINTMDYDISVLHLYNSIEFGSSALPIRLAPKNYIIPPGTDFTVTGWGSLSEAGKLPKELQVVEVPSISNEQCQQAYQDQEIISDRMMCAKADAGGRDSCQGDSGGPLVANGLLVGIVSWGYGCARPEYPGVYSKISEFRDFIKNVTNL